MSRVEKAIIYAIEGYKGLTRKYTGEDYVTHPIAVASLVNMVTSDEDMYIAALFHDLVEDTDLTIDDIKEEWGDKVADLVDSLTDVSTLKDGNRKTRKAIDREHISRACKDAKTIKLADLIHNTSSIVEYGGDFTDVYMKEKKLLLEVLIEGDEKLYKQASKIVTQYFSKE